MTVCIKLSHVGVTLRRMRFSVLFSFFHIFAVFSVALAIGLTRFVHNVALQLYYVP